MPRRYSLSMRSLQARILALALGLLVAVLAVTLVDVHRATRRHALARVANELGVGLAVVRDKMATRQRSLWDRADSLTKDPALRQAIFTDDGDSESLFVALNNHRVRAGADLALLVELDGRVRVDTRDSQARGELLPALGALRGDAPPHREPRLLALGGRLFQVATVPYYVPVSAPEPTFRLLLRTAADDPVARALADLSGLEVTFLGAAPGGERDAASPRLLASSLGEAARRALATAARGEGVPRRLELVEEDFLAASVPLGGTGGPFSALLLRPTAAAVLDFRALSGEVLWLALGCALLATCGAIVVARGITRPVLALEQAARRLADGDYAAPLPVGAGGEIGELAREFERMQQGIREREAAIHHLAFHDDLTGLANRNRFRVEVAEAIASASRARGRLAVAV